MGRDRETLIGPSRGSMSGLAIAGLGFAAIAATAVIGAGAGTRAGWWNFRLGFKILNWGAYFGVLGACLSLGGAIVARPGRGPRGFLLAVAGIVVGAIAFGVPANWYRAAKRLPPIHDISTDTHDPPQFASILPLRKNAPNPPEYGGPEVAAQQREAYPDIRPLELGLSPEQAYERALAAATRMGWRIVDGSRQEGRIEAVATTRWFGFEDDVVIRIAPRPENGTRLDVRSVSRVGRSDVGANARRIRAFLKTFRSMPPGR